MTESEFNDLADATLSRIDSALERVDADIDFELAAGGVLEIDCGSGGKIIVNRHTVAQEIWVAARSGGFHYRHDGTAWRNTRDGSELFASLSALLSAQCGEAVTLA